MLSVTLSYKLLVSILKKMTRITQVMRTSCARFRIDVLSKSLGNKSPSWVSLYIGKPVTYKSESSLQHGNYPRWVIPSRKSTIGSLCYSFWTCIICCYNLRPGHAFGYFPMLSKEPHCITCFLTYYWTLSGSHDPTVLRSRVFFTQKKWLSGRGWLNFSSPIPYQWLGMGRCGGWREQDGDGWL